MPTLEPASTFVPAPWRTQDVAGMTASPPYFFNAKTTKPADRGRYGMSRLLFLCALVVPLLSLLAKFFGLCDPVLSPTDATFETTVSLR